jgi:tetratricopeptide (TPR) repeat protein
MQRLGRPDAALAAFDDALERAPSDVAALAGRAEVLGALGRRLEAAETLVRLAETHEAEGRLTDACDAARRALELAESRTRRRFVERLVGRLRDSAGDTTAVEAMERAMGVLEPPMEPGGVAEPSLVASPDGPPVAGERPVEAPEPANATFAEEERAAPDPEVLVAVAESLVAAGDRAEARLRFLAAANAYRASGRLAAALDACLPVIGFDPADPGVHLLLADVYIDHGWRGPAAEKLRLLGRLAMLTGDGETERLAAELGAARLGPDFWPVAPPA